MFIGHAATGFAAKKLAPRASLAWLLVAPWLLDFLWPAFLVLGIERVRPRAAASPFLNLEFVSYPWSHSLLMALVLDEEGYACWAGGAMAGFSIAMIWAPVGKAIQVIAQLLGWTFVANNAVVQCI